MGNKLLLFILTIILLFIGYTKYIRMSSLEKDLIAQWSLIELEYQSKSDVIFNLSKLIKEADTVDHEVINDLLIARNVAAEVKVDLADLDADTFTEFREAYKDLLMIQEQLLQIANNIPDLSGTQKYRELKAELEGNEIRISNERRRFNEQVDLYNKYINGFFNIAIAQLFGFDDWFMFNLIPGE